MYIDAHTHLNSDKLFSQWKNEIQRFQEIGGVALTNIGANTIYNRRSIEIAEKSKQYFSDLSIKATIGLHPYEISIGNITYQNKEQKLDELYSLYNSTSKKHIVGIGEIGIDTHFSGSKKTLDLQKAVFGLQCKRAYELGLPIVIHTRDNRPATFEVLQNYKEMTIYFHCWPYGPSEIKQIKKTFKNFYIGFCGNISYPNASNIRKSLRYLVYENEKYSEAILSGKITASELSDKHTKNHTGNWERILLETDAPYLPFQDRRGKIQYPYEISKQYAYASQLLSHDVTMSVYKNFSKLYKTTLKA